MLTKERSLELGIEDEKADKILEEVNKDYVPNYRYKEVKDNLDNLSEDIKKRDKQIEGIVVPACAGVIVLFLCFFVLNSFCYKVFLYFSIFYTKKEHPTYYC